jgi:SynChlorMet cassette radical SAM/SPASM protein ScmF
MPFETSAQNSFSEEKIKLPDLPEGIPALYSFYIYITSGCNLFCRHCWITPKFVNGKPSPKDYLSLDILQQAVEEAKSLGLDQIKLTGGEPLLHPQFKEVIDFLTKENLNINLETNATLITASLAKYLKQDTNLRFVSTSMDSSKAEIHDRFRGVAGAFKAAVKGTENLIKAGFRPQVIMSPFKGNRDDVESLALFAAELGAGSVKFNPVTPAGRGAAMHQKGEGLDYEETISLVRFIRRDLQARVPIPLYIATPPAMSTIKELLQSGKAGGECRVLHILGLLGTGEMALCGIGRNIPELCFGRLGKDSIRDVWISHPVLNQLRRDLEDDLPGICGDCIHSQRCLTHCVAMNYQSTGKLIHPSFLCEEAVRRNEFPETRRRSYSG